MNEFDVKVEVDDFGKTRLHVTHNGYQWSAIRIDNPEGEIPQIIAALERHLATIERDTALPAEPKTRGKSKLFKTEGKTA